MSPKLNLRISTSGGYRERVVEYGLLPEERLENFIEPAQKIGDIKGALRGKRPDLDALQERLAEVVGENNSQIFFNAFKNWQEMKIEF